MKPINICSVVICRYMIVPHICEPFRVLAPLANVKTRGKNNVAFDSSARNFKFAIQSRISNDSGAISYFSTELVKPCYAAHNTSLVGIGKFANAFERYSQRPLVYHLYKTKLK